MKVLVLSYSFWEYDGRLQTLIKIGEELGTTYCISQAKLPKNEKENYFVYSPWKLCPYLGYLFYMIKIMRALKGIDILIADNRKAILPAILLNHLFPIKSMILDARELYLLRDNIGFSGKIGCIVETLFNKRFDIIICANSKRAEIMQEYYHLTDRPLVLENIRKLTYGCCDNEQKFCLKYKNFFSHGKFKIVSTDGGIFNRGLSQLLVAMKELGADYILYIIGCKDVAETTSLQKILDEYQLTNVVIIDRLPLGELKYFIHNCDLGIVTYSMETLNNIYCASGKIYEFIFENLPVVTSLNPPLVELCVQYQIGESSANYTSAITTIRTNYSFYKNNVVKLSKVLSPAKTIAHITNEILRKL